MKTETRSSMRKMTHFLGPHTPVFPMRTIGMPGGGEKDQKECAGGYSASHMSKSPSIDCWYEQPLKVLSQAATPDSLASYLGTWSQYRAAGWVISQARPLPVLAERGKMVCTFPSAVIPPYFPIPTVPHTTRLLTPSHEGYGFCS